MIVTDHHLPDDNPPPAFAVLNPRQPGCGYPDKDLCGAGVAFKLAQALLGSLEWPGEKFQRVMESFLKIVAIGTIADVVPLTGENRVMVKHGLDGFRSVRNPGLRALLRVAGFRGRRADRAAGRLPHRAEIERGGAYGGRQRHCQSAADTGGERGELSGGAAACAESRAPGSPGGIVRTILEDCLKTPVDDGQPVLVFVAPEWHRGIVGIVATRLMGAVPKAGVRAERRPEHGIAQGSGRSIPAFHLLDALESMRDLFIRFGGHRQAAGLTLSRDRVNEFRED